MPKPPEFPPYEGQIVWSPNDQWWVIRVTTHDGGMIPPQDVFQAPVLAHHLRCTGVESALASNNTTDYECVVWRSQQPDDLSTHGRALLKVLEAHYSQFKGRPIKWTLK